MDAVARSEPASDGGYRDAVAAFDRSVSGLKDSAELARLTDDPAAPSLVALLRVMESMAAQFRLRDRDRQAMADSTPLSPSSDVTTVSVRSSILGLAAMRSTR